MKFGIKELYLLWIRELTGVSVVGEGGGCCLAVESQSATSTDGVVD